MEDQRNFANIDRRVNSQDGRALQHFMSESPWSAQAVFQKVQRDIQAEPALRTSGLVVLESPDVKAGHHSAGVARQHNGRVGKIELSQMATCLTFVHPETSTWVLVDGELFLPEAWFTRAYATLRAEVGVPPERTFATKLELGQHMIERAQAHGLPFEMVACDEFYGRSRDLRAKWEAMGLGYAAQAPADTRVYLQPPSVTGPRHKAKANGRPPRSGRCRVVRNRIRSTRWVAGPAWDGNLEADFAVVPVWTVTKEGVVRAEM